MTSSEFLCEKLKKLVKTRPELKLTCKYDSFAREYYVVVSPSEYYELFSEDFGRVVIDFIEKYPYDTVTFLKVEDSIEFDKHDRVFKGVNYSIAEKAVCQSFASHFRFDLQTYKSPHHFEAFIMSDSQYQSSFNKITITITRSSASFVDYSENNDSIPEVNSETYGTVPDYSYAA